jgi:hypothetical protein
MYKEKGTVNNTDTDTDADAVVIEATYPLLLISLPHTHTHTQTHIYIRTMSDEWESKTVIGFKAKAPKVTKTSSDLNGEPLDPPQMASH